MFDEPEQPRPEPARSPDQRLIEKANELRLHAEIAAVFEGVRKFNADLRPGLDPDVAREIQRTMARLEKSKPADAPLLPGTHVTDAAGVLNLYADKNLSTNDYHLYRRPDEVMIVRWLAGDEVTSFYERLQAHFDAGLNHYRTEERDSQAWKQDDATLSYLALLDKLVISLEERYARDVVRKFGQFALSTQTADELNILFLTDHVMAIDASDLVGPGSAPDDPTDEKQLTWFYKLFILRGARAGVEQICLFTFLQKSDDESW